MTATHSKSTSLSILVTCNPEALGFAHTIGLAWAGLRGGLRVFIYCLDDAVPGVEGAELQSLKSEGVRLYACSHGALRHGIEMKDQAIFSGLPTLSDLISKADRFVCFS